jgi:hypothetical protein
VRWQTGLGLNKVNQIRRNQQMVKVQLRRIKNKLNENLANLIDMSDYANKRQEDKDKACLSRSYTAYSLVSLASAKEEEASQAIVDGFDDNGIDAIYYQE